MFVPIEKRATGQKLLPRGTKGRLLAVLGHKTYLVWLGGRQVIQTAFVKFYEDHKPHLQGPVGPTNSLDLPEVQEEEEPEEEATVPLPEPSALPELPLPTKIEVQLPQAPSHYKEDFQVVDSDPMDLSALVTHLVTKATATVAAISPNGSPEPNTFKQALNHPLKNHWLKAAFSEIRQLLTTKTFYFIDRLKASKSPITSR